MYLKLLIGTVVSAVGLSSTSAITMIGGINFQDNAFADSVISSSGSYTLAGGAANLSAAVTGSSLTKYALASGASVSTASINVGFTDNYLVNGAGTDLALFSMGPANFSITLSGTTKNYAGVNTFLSAHVDGTAYSVYKATINLDDFGAAAGAQFSTILIGMGILPNLPSLSVVGALNSAPVNQSVPDTGSTVSMLGMAIVGLGLLNRKLSRNFSLIK